MIIFLGLDSEVRLVRKIQSNELCKYKQIPHKILVLLRRMRICDCGFTFVNVVLHSHLSLVTFIPEQYSEHADFRSMVAETSIFGGCLYVLVLG